MWKKTIIKNTQLKQRPVPYSQGTIDINLTNCITADEITDLSNKLDIVLNTGMWNWCKFEFSCNF